MWHTSTPASHKKYFCKYKKFAIQNAKLYIIWQQYYLVMEWRIAKYFCTGYCSLMFASLGKYETG
jgi:hypothetical protein